MFEGYDDSTLMHFLKSRPDNGELVIVLENRFNPDGLAVHGMIRSTPLKYSNSKDFPQLFFSGYKIN